MAEAGGQGASGAGNSALALFLQGFELASTLGASVPCGWEELGRDGDRSPTLSRDRGVRLTLGATPVSRLL